MTLIEFLGPIPYWTLVVMLLTTAIPMVLVNVSTSYQEVYAQIKELQRVYYEAKKQDLPCEPKYDR